MCSHLLEYESPNLSKYILNAEVIKFSLKGQIFCIIFGSCYPGVVVRQKGKVTLATQMFISIPNSECTFMCTHEYFHIDNVF